jgi:hypothetical protein
VVLPDSKDVQPHLVGMFDLFDQVPHTVRRLDRTAGFVECRRETVNADLQRVRLLVAFGQGIDN